MWLSEIEKSRKRHADHIMIPRLASSRKGANKLKINVIINVIVSEFAKERDVGVWSRRPKIQKRIQYHF